MDIINEDYSGCVIELLERGNNVEEIALALSIKKSLVRSILGKYRQSIVREMDETKFYIILNIDKIIGRKGKVITNAGGFKVNEIYDLICSGYNNLSIISTLNISLYRYINLLKVIYSDLWIYGSKEEKVYIPLLKENIVESSRLLKKSKKRVSVKKDKELTKDENNGLSYDGKILTQKTQQVIEFKENKKFRFLVISDTHFGNEKENLRYLNEVYEYASKNGIKYIFHTGDLIEGEYSLFARCKSEYSSVPAQVEHVLSDYCYDKSIQNYLLFGNHDASSLINDGIDILPLLAERSDFTPLGYKVAYIKINDEYVSLKHVIPSLKSISVSEYNIFLNISGHSHRYKCDFNNSFFNFRVPTLSDVVFESDYSRGFLDCEVDFDNKKASELKVNYINFDQESLVIGFERKLKK